MFDDVCDNELQVWVGEFKAAATSLLASLDFHVSNAEDDAKGSRAREDVNAFVDMTIGVLARVGNDDDSARGPIDIGSTAGGHCCFPNGTVQGLVWAT